jgi:hypothetical protein
VLTLVAFALSAAAWGADPEVVAHWAARFASEPECGQVVHNRLLAFEDQIPEEQRPDTLLALWDTGDWMVRMHVRFAAEPREGVEPTVAHAALLLVVGAHDAGTLSRWLPRIPEAVLAQALAAVRDRPDADAIREAVAREAVTRESGTRGPR